MAICKCTELGDSVKKEEMVKVIVTFSIPTDNARETIREINHIASHYSMSILEVMKVFNVRNNDLKWEIREM